MPGPLTGLTVVEMAGLGPCPLAGQLLADLGADVVVIDRKSGTRIKQDINRRGKRSAALNLKSDKGRDLARRLIGKADILIEGFRPGVMEKLGLGPEEFHDDNPGLIYGRITGWGQNGPLAHTAGHDLNYLALTGILSGIGTRNAPPVPPLNMVADYGGGTMFLLFGVLAAVFERGRSGRGQVVDAAMIEGASAMTGLLHMMRASGQWMDRRESNLLDGAAPFYRCYETKDGKSLSVGCIEPQFFAEFLRLAGLPEAHCATQNDVSLWPARAQEYAQLIRTKTRDEWAQIFDGTDACVAPVMELDELMSHPHSQARGVYTDIGGITQSAPAPRFDRTPADAPTAPGAPGAETDAVLAELGFDPGEIDTLRQSGALT